MPIEFLTQAFFLDFRGVLELWRAAGLFDIVLPFILVFALIFAILEKSRILGHNRAVYAIIALAISFFTIQNSFVSKFFAILFSNAALGFAILLVFILFLGFFIQKGEGTWWVWLGGIFAIGVFFWVLSRSLHESGYVADVYSFLYANPFLASLLIYGVPLLLIIGAIVVLTPKSDDDTPIDIINRLRGKTH